VHRAALFDLDGTLIDSRQDLADSVNALLVELGAAPLPDPVVLSFVGNGARSLIRRAWAEAAPGRPVPGDGLLRRFLPLYEQRLLAHTVPYPGVVDGLERLKAAGVPMALVTNKPEAPARRILEGLGLSERFDCVLGGDSLQTKKPAPQMLLAAAAALGTPPARCLMVGDSDVDVEAGIAAGVPTVWCTWGGIHPDRPAQAESVADRFEQVVRRLLPA
jgi:phosphoglycolate phosphatase